MYAEEHGVGGSSPPLGTEQSEETGSKQTALLACGREQRNHVFSTKKNR